MPQFHDLPLPLPAPEFLLKAMLVIFFILHIIFVEMMVGATILCTYFEWKGLKEKNTFFDKVAFEIAKSITVNKSMAVVLGVGPLLLINVTYTIFFYSSSVLIGNAWILVIPMAISAFLITYLHQYAWDWFENYKKLHITLIAVASLHFLIIPFFFLTNTNLMWFPTVWDQIHGFFSALFYPNIFARYFFFLSTTLTVTGFFLNWLFNKKIKNDEFHYPNKDSLDNLFLSFNRFVLVGMFGQIFFGSVVIFTAQKEGLDKNLIPLLIGVAIFFIPPMINMAKANLNKKNLSDFQFKTTVVSLFISIIFAGVLRHHFRENALLPHQVNMKKNTEIYLEKIKNAKKNYGVKDYKYE